MPEVQCGFANQRAGAELLADYGPRIRVDIGFDPAYSAKTPGSIPVPGIKDVSALIDTGAGDNCIDSLLATQLGLPVVDRADVAGSNGSHAVNVHLAQIHFPALGLTLNERFFGVHLTAGGQPHQALIGRTFLRHCTLVYDGPKGSVIISR